MAEIDLLRTFLAVYRAGSFTRAAGELHLSQPAVSLQVRSLEARVGKPLFTRQPRGAMPTAAGHEMAQAAAAHLDALEGLLSPGTGSGAAAVAESVYLGGPEEFVTVRVLPVLAPLVRAGMHLRMRFDVDPPNLRRLRDGELDLAVVTSEQATRGLESERLCFEYLELVAAPAWAERFEGRLVVGPAGAALLDGAPLVSYAEDLPLARTYWQAVFRSTPRMRATVVANSLRAALQMVVRGAGITVLPAHVTREAVERGELVRLLRLDEPPRNSLHLAWRAGALRRQSIALVREEIRAAAPDW